MSKGRSEEHSERRRVVRRRYTQEFKEEAERTLPGPREKSPSFLFSDCTARPIRWLWNEYIPQGMVTLLVGDPGVGKSFFSIDLAARVSRGESIPPDGKLGDGPGRVLFLAADDHPDDIMLPQLVAAGADLTRVAGIRNNDFEYLSKEADPLLSLAKDIDRVEYALHRLPEARLVVIDPISAYLDGIDINNNVEVRGLLMRLAAMARVYDVAMLLISHHRKAGAPSVLYRALGALAFTSSARVVLSMVRVAGPVISDAALAFGLPTDQDELEAFYNSRRTSSDS